MADEENFQIDPNEYRDARGVIARNAQWAEMFGGASTNLAQRQRFQEDISKERGARMTEKEQAFNRSLLDKDARDLYFKDKAANLARARATHDMDLKQKKFEMDAERFPLQMDNERLKLRVQEGALDNATAREARAAKNALRADQQTEDFENSIQAMIDDPDSNPHSQAFADGLAKAYAKNPYADKSVVGQWFKNSRIQTTPEEFQEMVDKYGGKGNMDVTITEGPNGRTFTARPKRTAPNKIDTTVQQDERMLDSLRAKLSDPRTVDDDYKEYLKERINTIQGRLNSGSKSGEELGKLVSSVGALENPAKEALVSMGSAKQIEKNLSFDNDPSGFKSAFESATPGTVLTYNGKKYRKPEAK